MFNLSGFIEVASECNEDRILLIGVSDVGGKKPLVCLTWVSDCYESSLNGMTHICYEACSSSDSEDQP